MIHHGNGIVSLRRRWKVVLPILCFSGRPVLYGPFAEGFSQFPTSSSRIQPIRQGALAPKQREKLHRSLIQQQQSTDLEVDVLNPKKGEAISTPTTTAPIPIIAMDQVVFPSPFTDNDEDNRKDVGTVLALLWLIAAISALDRVAMSVALVPMASEFHFTDSTSGSISSLFSVGYGLAILPAGLLVSCISPKQVLGCGVAVWSLATLATPTCAALLPIVALPILLIRALVGMGEAMVIPTIHRLLSVWTSMQQKSSGECCSAVIRLLLIFLPHVSLISNFFNLHSHCVHLQRLSCRYHWRLLAVPYDT
jgi:Major Facilitator Superfamily